MTPTKESLDRARTWMANQMPAPTTGEQDVNSLAIEFDRVRLEGKIEAYGNAARIAYRDGSIWSKIRGVSHAESDQLAALNQPRPLRAGEKEG